MKGMIPLLRKEIKEQLVTYRFLIVSAVFLLFGIAMPLLQKYSAQLLSGSTEGASITLPPPSAAAALMDYISSIAQFGLLVVVLMAMGAIANEIKHGTAIVSLTKPVSRTAFVTSKLAALSMTFVVSLGIGSTICFAYSTWLIGPVSLSPFIGLNLLFALFLVFCLALTLLFSSLFRSSLVAGGLAMGSIIVSQTALNSIPVAGKFTPGRLLEWGINLLNAQDATYWGAVIFTAVAVVACVVGARTILCRREV
jgi:ABC-2 type transport system permease protein